MTRAIPLLLFVATTAMSCPEKKELPPPPPDFCTFYTPWYLSPQPAALETEANLRTHAGNNLGHYQKCIVDNPALDPKRSGGPR